MAIKTRILQVSHSCNISDWSSLCSGLSSGKIPACRSTCPQYNGLKIVLKKVTNFYFSQLTLPSLSKCDSTVYVWRMLTARFSNQKCWFCSCILVTCSVKRGIKNTFYLLVSIKVKSLVSSLWIWSLPVPVLSAREWTGEYPGPTSSSFSSCCFGSQWQSSISTLQISGIRRWQSCNRNVQFSNFLYIFWF